MQRFILVVFGILLVLFLASACGGGEGDQPVTVKIEVVEFPGGVKVPVTESEDPGCKKQEGCLKLDTEELFSQVPQETIEQARSLVGRVRPLLRFLGDLSPEVTALIIIELIQFLSSE